MNFLDEKNYEQYAKTMNKIDQVNFFAQKYSKAKKISKKQQENSLHFKEIFRQILQLQGYGEKNFAKNYLLNNLYPKYMRSKLDSQKDQFENMKNAPISDCLPYIFSKHLSDKKFDALWEVFVNFGHIDYDEFSQDKQNFNIAFVPYFFDSEVGKKFKNLLTEEIIADAQNTIGKKHDRLMQKAISKIENKDFELQY